MKESPPKPEQQRAQLLRQIDHLARRVLFGTISETYRTCGTSSCSCHRDGPKHGPHVYVSYRGDKGKTTGYYVPTRIQADVREGIDAWSTLQNLLRQLAQINKERLMEAGRRKKAAFATGSS